MKLLAFRDLQALGVVGNRTQLSRLIRKHAFPAGVLISANSRRWREDEIVSWLAGRPIQRPTQRPARRADEAAS